MARTSFGVHRGRAVAAAAVAVTGAVIVSVSLWPSAAPSGPAGLRLSSLKAVSDPDARRFSAPSSLRSASRPAVVVRKAATSAGTTLTFGQPTMAGVNGFGFEADLRLDPTNPNRIFMSAPGTGGADDSWIWRSLDGGRTFKWIPATTPATALSEGKVDAPCAGGGDTELAVDSAGHLYFNDLSLANFSTARSDDGGQTLPCSTTGVPDAGVDRQWYALDGDPTAGGSLYLTNDEIETGAPQCGSTQGNNTLVMYRSPPAGAGASAGIEFGPANHITQPGSCDEGIMGPDEVSPVATSTGLNGVVLPAPVRHVYVVHDDGSLSRILVARCFPVAFGPPLANVSDPSGLDCVDLPVADLGGGVRTGGNFPALAIDRAGNLYAVWEQAPVDSSGEVGDSSLMYSYSTNEGTTWSTPVQIPTPGLANNVYAWAAAGDDGRVDIAWYGTPAHADPSSAQCPKGGPDSAAGSWSLYLTQTQNGHSSSVAFTAPQLASEHPVRRGGIQTIIGFQCADDPTTGHTVRTLGDFLQLRIGSKGEAQISYADSTNFDGQVYGSHAMYVRQIGGPGVYKGKSPSGDPVQLNSVTDPAGDATFDAAGQVSANMPNLDILGSSLAFPKPSSCHPAGSACLRVTMKVANMSTAAPVSPDTDSDAVWLTQWLDPSAPSCTSPAPSCQNGGLNFIAYGESTSGGAVQCWTGQSAVFQNLGGIALTYPGSTQITAPGACKVVTGAGGSLTIDVPLSDVSLDPGVAPFSSKLYSVTASTMTLQEPANTIPWSGGVGGIFFNVIDQARSYDAKP